ncbi:uncharacterized protein LOC124355099 isoform X2 [Homalodisca vitripennis]|nr:uncharacterized protein LOC124355099 isoform X2 [Homalodisca vitripennis]KAG8273776.1 hypothetical protein J6590_014415 [Homalodisca vitripennis]
MIEDGRTLNGNKTTGSNKFRGDFATPNKTHILNGSSSVGMEHLELHFNITNVFEDNSDNRPFLTHHYVEYEGEELGEFENSNITDNVAASINVGIEEDTPGKNILKKKSYSKKASDKALNAPVYLVFA